MGVLASQLSEAAGAAASLAAVLGVLITWATWWASRRSKKGSDLDQLAGTLSEWSERTIDRLHKEVVEKDQELHRELEAAERRCKERCDMKVSRVRAELEGQLAVAGYRIRYYQERLGIDPGNTPPPPNKPRPT